MSKFIVDSNFFIQAHRATYPLDVAKSFWVKIKILSDRNVIVSIDKVKNEIYDNSSHEDELKSWSESNLPSNFFMNTQSVLNKYIEISNWATLNQHGYQQNAIDEFLQAGLADPWLVAFAMTNNWTIITQEKSEPNIKRKIKIPEVCNQFNIKYINTIDLFRELRETF